METFEQLQMAVAHDACSPRYRTPCGAVTFGTAVRVFLSVEDGARSLVRSVRVRVGEYACGSDVLEWREVAMEPCRGGFSAEFGFARRPHAAFYAFAVDAGDGDGAFLYVPRADGRSTFGELVRDGVDGTWGKAGWRFAQGRMPSPGVHAFGVPGPRPGFQVSIYDPAFRTPEWMRGAVMYQVFPDRFARGEGGVREAGVAYHRQMGRPVHLHASWDDPLAWQGGAEYDPVDFFGGTLEGVREKLPYLASLGVEVLYLNPVFEARSNHRYDTADYLRIDPMLGTQADFVRLAADARTFGISIVLDAVLSHTGDDSRYFDAKGVYGGSGRARGDGGDDGSGALAGNARDMLRVDVAGALAGIAPGALEEDAPGAARSADSPFRSWYDFTPQDNGVPYRCWWGHPSLPEVDEHDPGWQRFVLGDGAAGASGEEGVLPHWIGAGARGYRLDVADEIPDDVLERIRDSVKRADPEAAVIGEVWEDATSKVSYGAARTYALGRALDSVMNYPLRDALLGFAIGTVDALQLASFLKLQAGNYPAPMHACLMNLVGSHDVERVRSVLALGGPVKQLAREEQVRLVGSVSRERDSAAARLQRMAVALLYALPGMPCVYYGDEAGLQGGGDPFCRATMPWGPSRDARQDCGLDLTAFYRRVGMARKESPALRVGASAYAAVGPDVLCVLRFGPEGAGASAPAAGPSGQSSRAGADTGSTEPSGAGFSGPVPCSGAGAVAVLAVANRADSARLVSVDLMALRESVAGAGGARYGLESPDAMEGAGMVPGCCPELPRYGLESPDAMERAEPAPVLCSEAGRTADARAFLRDGVVQVQAPPCSTTWFPLSLAQ